MTIYYDPEAYGLTLFGVLDQEDLFYEFHMLAVWADSDGQLWWASDSGCSCPSPFEDHTSIESLDRIDARHLDGVLDAIRAFPASGPDKVQLTKRILEHVRVHSRS